MTNDSISLDDKYLKQQGRIYITGVQSFVRALLLQKQKDLKNNLNTAGFISGYRGSPLATLDQEVWRASKHLSSSSIAFKPGLNEDLAATAVWGTQQAQLYPSNVDGTFSLWYGKGPGVDRCGDVFRHANAAGTSKHGGVVVAAGDDHASKSSSFPHHSEYALIDASIPIFVPSTPEEVTAMTLAGFALSRYSGLWSAVKVASDVANNTVSYDVKGEIDFKNPEWAFDDHPHIRWPDSPLNQEKRLFDVKLPAAKLFLQANHFNHVLSSPHGGRAAIVTSGKSYLDVLQAFDILGLTQSDLDRLGIRLIKIGAVWPLDDHFIKLSLSGLEKVLVVEEKRDVLEAQIKDILYHMDASLRPQVVGKFDVDGAMLCPSAYEFDSVKIVDILLKAFSNYLIAGAFEHRLQELYKAGELSKNFSAAQDRLPFYCSGCPHNTSTTQLPEGSRAMAGIGCHYMAMWIGHDTQTFTHMGGEGVPWIGQADYVNEKHVFANMGDGTYFHSGSLAVRAAVSAKAVMTFKILFNDAVAMTGGQPVDGVLTVDRLASQVSAEGVRRIAVVSDDIEKYNRKLFPNNVTFHHRDALQSVQEELRLFEGVSVLIYDQTCAAEKRRRRKKKVMVDPAKRLFINPAVCEGCGDCSKKSNCLSVMPVETELGRKRTIDQTSCNKDYSCVKGFCPSFISIEGDFARHGVNPTPLHFDAPLVEPTFVFDKNFHMILTGIGGTGITTLAAILGIAAHMEGKSCSLLDMTGLSQMGGAVYSYISISDDGSKKMPGKIADGQIDLLLGVDLLVSAKPEILSKLNIGHTQCVMSGHEKVSGAFIKDPDFKVGGDQIVANFKSMIDDSHFHLIDANRLSEKLLGDTVCTNVLLTGFAFQKGFLPLKLESIEAAIRLNGASVDKNMYAFTMGRRIALDLSLEQKILEQHSDEALDEIIQAPLETLDEKISYRAAFLKDYQNKKLADHFLSVVENVKKKDEGFSKDNLLTKNVAETLFKLLSYKDEYEVARLYSSTSFVERVKKQFKDPKNIKIHLAPPLLAKKDPKTGELLKKPYGLWVLRGFKVLAKFKFLRGSAFDLFGKTGERKMERQLIKDYQALLNDLLAGLTSDNYDDVASILKLAQDIKGFGHVKERNVKLYKEQLTKALENLWAKRQNIAI